MNARDNTPLTIRDRIKAHLGSVEQASATVIASAIGEASTPSRVVKELNAMRTDALVECEQRGKKKELVYWLAVPVEAPSSEDAPAAEPELPALPHNFRPGTRKAQVMNLLKPGAQLAVSEMCKRLGLNPGCLDTVIDELFRMGHIKREKPTGGGPYVYFRGSGTPHQSPNTVVSAPAAGGDTDSEGGETDVSRNEMPKATENPYLTPEMQYLSPEDYELPDPDPVLLASANRMLAERLAGVAHVLRGSGLPALADIDDGENLQPHVAALAGAYQMACAEPEMLRQELAKADDELTEVAEALARILWEGSDIDPADMDLGELVTEAGKQMQRLRLEIETLKNNYSVQVQEGEGLRQRLEALRRTAPTDPSYPTLPTYSAGKYQTRVGTLFVMQPDDTIYSEMTTTVSIDDKGGGEFVVVNQHGDKDLGKVIIYQDEWPALATAINLMIAQCRGDK